MAFGDAQDFAPRGLPIAGDPRPDEYSLAPPPQIDRYPVVIGPGLSLSYISAIFRLSTSGYRQQYVDLLDEMLEKDPHAYSVVAKRANGVAGGRFELEAPKFDAKSNDEKKAQEVLKVVQTQIDAIPDFYTHLTSLAWGVFWGIAGLENHWVRDGKGWQLERFSFIHSRRLAYPRPMSWDLCIWDQGLVSAWGLPPALDRTHNPFSLPRTTPRLPGFRGPTEGAYGLRIADYPGKFTIYAPQVRGNYPTREGVGREIAYWMALKLVAARAAPVYLERFAKPWPEGTFKTGDSDQIRKATTEDIRMAEAALKTMGAGSIASWVHPDSVKLELRNPDGGANSKVTFGEWIGICNAEESKAVLGGTLSTEVGSTGGNRSLGDTQKKGETTLFKQDARMLAGSLSRDAIRWIVLLNFGEDALKYAPIARLHIEDDPDPTLVIERAVKAAGGGVPVDADWLAESVGLKVVEPGEAGLKQRRMFPILGTKAPEEYDADLAARAEKNREDFPPPAPPPGLGPDGQPLALPGEEDEGDGEPKKLPAAKKPKATAKKAPKTKKTKPPPEKDE